MQDYRLFDPADFGLYGSPADDESYVILEKLDRFKNPTSKAVLTYISCDDFTKPPSVDYGTMEEFELNPGAVKPVFEHLAVRKDGQIVLDGEGDCMQLTEKQNELLGAPYRIQTLHAKYDTEYNNGGPMAFYKDLTLEGIKAVKLNGRKFTDAVREKYPALLESTHAKYGNTPPYFPFGKYFESRDKMVVFLAKSQIQELSEAVVNGDIPCYYDFFMNEKWDSSNIYGFCIVDDETEDYNIRLVSPEVLKLMHEDMQMAKPEKKEEIIAKR